MTQYARPDSDIATGSWTTTPLYQKIDETTPSDSDWIQTTVNASTCEIGLGNLSDPGASNNHTVKYRGWKLGIVFSFTVALFQGSTQIASWGDTLTESWAEYSHTLTSGQADSITDYTDLRLKFTSSIFTGGQAVSWAVFEVPDAPGISDNQPAYSKGVDTGADNQLAYLEGAYSASTTKNAYTQGGLDTYDFHSAFTEGSTAPTSSLDAYLKGPTDSLIEIRSNQGYLLSYNNDVCRARGWVTPTANEELLVKVRHVANDDVNTQINFFLRASDDWWTSYYCKQGYRLAISHYPPSSDIVYLYRIGGGSNIQIDSANWTWNNKTFWVRFRCDGTEIKGRLWEAGTSEPGTWLVDVDDGGSAITDPGTFQLSLRGETSETTAVFLDDLSVHSPTGSYDAFDNQSAYLQGLSNATPDNQSAFCEGSLGSSDNQSVYLKGLDTDLNNQKVYIHGQQHTSDNQFVYIEGAWGSYDNQPVYLEGWAADIITSKSAFLRGGIKDSDNQPCYTRGLDTHISVRKAYTKGKTGASDNQSAFLSGSLGSTDNQKAFIQGSSTDTTSSKSAFANGGLSSSDNTKAYTDGIANSLDNIPAYTMGMIPRIHAYTKGIGLTRPYIWLIDSNGTVEKKFKVALMGIQDGTRIARRVTQYTIEGKIDLSSQESATQWQYMIRVKGDDSEYGDIENLKYFFDLNDPNGSPTNIITLIDHNQEQHYVYIVGSFPENYVKYSTLRDDVLAFVPLTLVEV